MHTRKVVMTPTPHIRYFLVSFSHTKGFGRRVFGTQSAVNEVLLDLWEKDFARANILTGVVVLAVSEIDGPIENPRELNYGEKT